MSIRFFLSLFIILLSGVSQTRANSYQDDCNPTEKNLKNSECSNSDSIENNLDFILRSTTPAIEKEIDKIRVTNNESEVDVELTPAKKYLELNNYFATVFYANTPVSFCRYIKNRLHASKHFFSPSCKHYIRFRVFRI